MQIKLQNVTFGTVFVGEKGIIIEYKMKEVALVCSSGSSRGLTQIGAIDALIERGYHIHSVAGCSIGAIIGGLYAAGKLEELKSFFREMNMRQMFRLSDFSVGREYLIKGSKLLDTFGSMIPDYRIEDLPTPLALIATDIRTGREQVFREGNLATLIRASFSLPVILRPVEYQDMLLVDGGVTNPLPLNRVDRKDGDILVALNVSAPIDTGKDTPSQLPFSLLDRVSDIMLVQNSELMKQLCPPDMEMQIAINDLGTYDYDKADELIALGHELMTREIDRYEKTHS